MALCPVTLGTHPVVPAGNVPLHAADPQGELCLQSLRSPAWHLNSPSREGEAPREYRHCLTVLCFLQGGREVSDFISYLKREATNTPVLQEEDKPKKSKKKVKEDL